MKQKKQLGKAVQFTTANKMIDDSALDKELFEWKQSQLEKGKFPCICGHLESMHVKNLCLGCHGEDTHPASAHGEGWAVGSCFHRFVQMDNLTLIEWVAQNKEGLK